MSGKRPSKKKAQPAERPGASTARARAARPSALLDTRIIYCGDCLDRLAKLPDGCVDLIYIDPPFNSNRNYEVFWGDLSEPRPSGSGPLPAFEDRRASTQAYIDYMRPRCVELARVLKKTGSFYYHCDWHVSHHVRNPSEGRSFDPSRLCRIPTAKGVPPTWQSTSSSPWWMLRQRAFLRRRTIA